MSALLTATEQQTQNNARYVRPTAVCNADMKLMLQHRRVRFMLAPYIDHVQLINVINNLSDEIALQNKEDAYMIYQAIERAISLRKLRFLGPRAYSVLLNGVKTAGADQYHAARTLAFLINNENITDEMRDFLCTSLGIYVLLGDTPYDVYLRIIKCSKLNPAYMDLVWPELYVDEEY